MSIPADLWDRVGQIAADKLTLYLQARGWSKAATLNDVLDVWSVDAVATVRIPLRENLADSRRLMREALSVLSDVESRGVRDVLIDILNIASDIIKFPCDPDFASLGTMPLEKGVSAHFGAKSLLLSAARGIFHPQNAFAGAPPNEVQIFMKAAQLAQPEVGSYVIRVLSPVILPAHADREPFARRVSRGIPDLMRALTDAAVASVIENDLSPFKAAVERGVSANLCDAVMNLSMASKDGAVEIETLLAAGPSTKPEYRREAIASNAVQTLIRATPYLKGLEPEANVQLEGDVVVLAREVTTRGVSDVVLLCEVDDRERRVFLTVTGKDKDRLVDAYRAERPVQIVGTLDRSKPRYTLIDIRKIDVLPKPPQLNV